MMPEQPGADPIGAFRRHVRATPRRAFDDLEATPREAGPALVTEAHRLVTAGWQRWGHAIPSLVPPLAWTGERGSFDYALNAWEPLVVLLTAHSATGERAHFEAALAVALDWCRQNLEPLLAPGPDGATADEEAVIDRIVAAPGKSVWYDMAVGYRIYRLAYVLDVAARDEACSDTVVGRLAGALSFHHRLLARDAFFARRSNHGVYQALGQLAAARRFEALPEHGPWRDFALARVRELLDAHVLASGVHKEHSPGYHYMVLGSFLGAVASGVIVEPDLIARTAAMQTALGWMIQPDGGLVTFGDSDPRPMRSSAAAAARIEDPTVRWYFRPEGDGAAAVASGVAAYPDAGYAFARLYAPDVPREPAHASYLAHMAAYHSNVHKHADHGTFVWFDRRRDILVDPGRYAYEGRTPRGSALAREGFMYSAPERLYVEATRAHNCIEIDATSYPRRGVAPFGSALLYAGEQGALAVTSCAFTHFRSVRHRRVLVMAPGHFLLLLDWLHDRTATPRHYRQWLQLAPAWEAEAAGNAVVARHAGGEGAPPAVLTIASLVEGPRPETLARGRHEPTWQGWTSDRAMSLVPSWSIAFATTAAATPSAFVTLLTLAGELAVDPARTRFNTSLRQGTASWRDTRGAHCLHLFPGPDGHPRVTLQSR